MLETGDVARRTIVLNWAQWGIALSVCLTVAGCGGSKGPDMGKALAVHGKVTMDGEPAASVDVTFSRTQGAATPEARQFTARTDAGGQYSIPKIYEGDYHVMVYDPKEVQEREQSGAALETGKYKDYGVNSTLSVKVAEGSTQHDFDLKSK